MIWFLAMFFSLINLVYSTNCMTRFPVHLLWINKVRLHINLFISFLKIRHWIVLSHNFCWFQKMCFIRLSLHLHLCLNSRWLFLLLRQIWFFLLRKNRSFRLFWLFNNRLRKTFVFNLEFIQLTFRFVWNIIYFWWLHIAG